MKIKKVNEMNEGLEEKTDFYNRLKNMAEEIFDDATTNEEHEEYLTFQEYWDLNADELIAKYEILK